MNLLKNDDKLQKIKICEMQHLKKRQGILNVFILCYIDIYIGKNVKIRKSD